MRQWFSSGREDAPWNPGRNDGRPPAEMTRVARYSGTAVPSGSLALEAGADGFDSATFSGCAVRG